MLNAIQPLSPNTTGGGAIRCTLTTPDSTLMLYRSNGALSAIFRPTTYVYGSTTLHFSNIPTEFAPCVPDDVTVVSKRMSPLDLSTKSPADDDLVTVYLRRSGANWKPSVVLKRTIEGNNNNYMALDIVPCGEYEEVTA